MAGLMEGDGGAARLEHGGRLAELEAENARLRALLAEREQQVDRLQAAAILDTQIRVVADALPVLIAYVDAGQRYRYNNKAYEAWFGCKRSRLYARTVREVMGESAFEQVRPLVEAALAGERVSADIALTYEHAGERFIHLEYVPDRRGDGSVAGFFALVQDVSESKKVEQTLRESEARFRMMADCAPAPVWVTGGEGIEFVNRAFVDTAGLDPDRLTGHVWMEIVHPDDLAEALERRREAWETKSAYAYEARFRRADGEWRWMHVSCNPRLDEAGTLTGYVGMAVDFTEQKRAEDELRESEARFRAMADSAPAPVWVTNEAGIEFANRALAEFTGLAVEALSGAVWMSLVHPDDIETVKQARAQAWQSRTSYQFEARFRRHDGAWRWLRARCKPRESDGEFLGYVGLAIDVTESRLAEQELRASEALLRAMFDNAGVGMVMMDGECRIERANAAFCAIVGRDPTELTGTSSLEFTHPDDVEGNRQAIDAIAGGAGAFAFEKRYTGKDGRIIWVRITLSGVGGQLLAIVEDVSARKVAEAALNDLNQSLESRIEAAIAERERVEAALRQAQKMEAVGHLTGGIAHDFNNLLTVISGNLDLAARRLDEDASPALRRAIDGAATGAERAATLTQRLLAFSRRQPLAPKPVDPNALVAGMSDLLHRTLGETIRIETRLAAGLSRIEVDPHQLESAILNLAVNARDAMPGGGRLSIETASVALEGESIDDEPVAPGPYVAIIVADDGHGMNPETLRRAIEPFFTTKEVGKGTGLGLSMVYGFVRQSGGYLRIESEAKEGTRIHIYLPRLAARAVDDEASRATEAPRARRGETVLVCEDDEDVRAYTAELLAELGYRVVEAQDGAATLALLEAEARVDLLFTDVVLPGGMSGAELAVRAQAVRPGLRIVYTTGYARDAIVHEGRLDADVELIAKPFTLAELATRLREMLDRD